MVKKKSKSAKHKNSKSNNSNKSNRESNTGKKHESSRKKGNNNDNKRLFLILGGVVLLVVVLGLLFFFSSSDNSSAPSETKDLNTGVQEAVVDNTPEEPVIDNTPVEEKVPFIELANLPPKCVLDKEDSDLFYDEVSSFEGVKGFSVIKCSSYTGSDPVQKENSWAYLLLLKFGSSDEASTAFSEAENTVYSSEVPSRFRLVDGVEEKGSFKRLSLGEKGEGFLITIKNDRGEEERFFTSLALYNDYVIISRGITFYKPYSDTFMRTYYPVTELVLNGFTRGTILLLP